MIRFNELHRPISEVRVFRAQNPVQMDGRIL